MVRLFFIILSGLALPLSPLCRAAFAAERGSHRRNCRGRERRNHHLFAGSLARRPARTIAPYAIHGRRARQTGRNRRAKLALKDLIDRQLIIQAFKKENYQIPDHFVDERMHEIIQENFGGDRNTFIKTLEAQNYTMGEFKKLEMERMIVQAMRGKNVTRDLIASPVKIEEYYKAHREEFTAKEQIKLRMIMIPSHASDGNAAAQKAMAEEILGKLAHGAEFDRMAQIYSEDSSRDLGGDWGWVDRKTLAGPLERIAFDLPVGKISNIIDFSGNYYILKVEDKHVGETRSLASVRDEIEKKLIQEEAQNLQEKWLASLRSKAYIRTF